MKSIIGVLLRSGKSESNLDIKYLYNDINNAIYKSGGIPIGIDNMYIDEYLNICNGFIIPGGDDITDEDILAIKKIITKDMPIIGICLGMQEIVTIYNGKIIDIDNHKHNGMHEITIKKDSLLYKILGCEKTLVNSRHKSAVILTNLNISALSDDNIAEAVEDHNKRFLLGLEWHPENMYDKDLNSRKIFDYFIKICNDNN